MLNYLRAHISIHYVNTRGPHLFSYFHLEYMVYKMVFLFVHIIQAVRSCLNHEHFLFFALPYLIGDIFVLFV